MPNGAYHAGRDASRGSGQARKQRRLALGSNRPALIGQGSAAAELLQVWEARRARYHAVADVTYDVSAESADRTEDLERKASDMEVLLRQFPRFHPAG